MIIGCPLVKEIGCSFVSGTGRSYLMLGTQLILKSPEQKGPTDTLVCEIKIPFPVSFPSTDPHPIINKTSEYQNLSPSSP